VKKDVPIEIEIEVVEAGQPRPQRPGPEPFGVARLRLFPGVIVRSAELVSKGKGRTGAKAGIVRLCPDRFPQTGSTPFRQSGLSTEPPLSLEEVLNSDSLRRFLDAF
jgi:hypothetical protein